MQEVKIKCPHCQTALKVMNPDNLAEKAIKCPQCNTSLMVKFNAGGNAPTPPRRPENDEGETVISQTNATRQHFYLKVEDKTYQLSEGVNTIGRHANTSSATIQIDTDDHKMSRHHAQIEVMRYPSGIYRVLINNWQNKNMTWVNGVELKEDETIILKNGSRVTMGTTDMFFISENEK